MAKDDEDIQFEIEPDEQHGETVEVGKDEAVAGAKAADGEADKGADDKARDDPIKSLQSQLEAKTQETEAERSKRLSAEHGRDQARADAERERARSANADYQSVTHALEATTAQIADIKREIKNAYESGDYEKIADAQEKLAELAPKRVWLENQKASIDERLKNPQQAPTDPVDALIYHVAATGKPLSPRAQAWFREHPEVAGDDEMLAKVQWIDKAARKRAITSDSDEYYDFVNEQMGFTNAKANGKAADAGAEVVEKAASNGARKVLTSAPVTRDNAVANGRPGGDVVKLTANEARAAQDGTLVWNMDDPKRGAKKGEPIGLKEMARRKAKGLKEGAYDKIHLAQ